MTNKYCPNHSSISSWKKKSNSFEIKQTIEGPQHGFRRNSLYPINLLDIFHYISTVYDQNRCVDIYFDCQKAFDKVPHKKLMTEVRTLGIKRKIADYFEK